MKSKKGKFIVIEHATTNLSEFNSILRQTDNKIYSVLISQKLKCVESGLDAKILGVAKDCELMYNSFGICIDEIGLNKFVIKCGDIEFKEVE